MKKEQLRSTLLRNELKNFDFIGSIRDELDFHNEPDPRQKAHYEHETDRHFNYR